MVVVTVEPPIWISAASGSIMIVLVALEVAATSRVAVEVTLILVEIMVGIFLLRVGFRSCIECGHCMR